MRSVVILLLCLSWTASLSPKLSEEERKKFEELFGTAPPPTTGSVNLTPGTNITTNRGGDGSGNQKPNTTSSGGNDLVSDCETSEGKPGVCVQHYLCNPASGTVITDGTGILDMRLRECPHYLQVCCLLDGVREKPPTPKVPPQQCGFTKADGQTFRMSNENAEFGEFPWMVALLKRSEATAWSQGDYLGGGSIIHRSVVMTAAHKVSGKQPAEVKCRGGEWDTQTENELHPHQERNVKKIVSNTDYYAPSVYNSIALLILETPFDLDYAPHMGVACVMPQLPPAGTQCYSMGWGREFADKEKYAVILKKVQVPIVSRDKCQKALRRTRLGVHFVLHPSLMCAGGQVGKDTCLGDGGSPLVCPIGDVAPGKEASRYAITGMVAWGLGCGTATPAVYVNVPHLHDWLAQRMREEGFGSDSYTY